MDGRNDGCRSDRCREATVMVRRRAGAGEQPKHRQAITNGHPVGCPRHTDRRRARGACRECTGTSGNSSGQAVCAPAASRRVRKRRGCAGGLPPTLRVEWRHCRCVGCTCPCIPAFTGTPPDTVCRSGVRRKIDRWGMRLSAKGVRTYGLPVWLRILVGDRIRFAAWLAHVATWGSAAVRL